PRGPPLDWWMAGEYDSGEEPEFFTSRGRQGGRLMISMRTAVRATTLSVAAMIAVPGAAQALPNFPKWFVNAKTLPTEREPFTMFSLITHQNKVLRNITCAMIGEGVVWNERTEGTEKGLAETSQFSNAQCKAEQPCKVKNTKGEEEEGIYLTAEAPPIV